MKVAPPELDESIIIVKSGSGGFELRYWNRLTGGGPIGPRLARKDSMPNLPTQAQLQLAPIQLVLVARVRALALAPRAQSFHGLRRQRITFYCTGMAPSRAFQLLTT